MRERPARAEIALAHEKKSGEPTADQNGVITQKLNELRHAESGV